VVRQELAGPVRLPSTMVAGLLVEKVLPVYPVIAKETHIEGVVVLQATISKSGTIENLRVESGPPMLRQAALDAVSNWRYRPYLLNGKPVEVETTVNVVFRLAQ
jgi:protein TonB